MDKAELAALLTAHGGRTQSVASLHVLRSPSLSAEDHAFLVDSAAALATIDLSRWLSRASAEQRPAVIDALAWLAEKDPARFEFEIARAPGFGLERVERDALADRLRGRVPQRLVNALSPDPNAPEPPPTLPMTRSRPPTAPPPAGGVEGEGLFDAADLLSDMDFGSEGGGGSGAAAPVDGLEGLFDDADGAFARPRAPLLDALLADVPPKKSRKAHAEWKARSVAAAKDTAEDWAPSVTRLSADMLEAAAARAAVSPRPEERAALLEWLLQNDERRSTLVSLTLGTLDLGDSAQNIRGWLSQSWIPRLLSDKPGWTKFGARLLAALIERGAFSELDDLFTAVIGEAGSKLSATPGSTRDLRGPLFSALYEALAGMLRQGLADDPSQKALACAAALACIGVPAQKSLAVQALRRKRAAKGEIATLLALALKQGRGPKKPPDLEDFIAAVHTLSSAMR